MANISTPAGIGVSASAKETLTIMAGGVGLIILLYWLAKREIKGAASAVGNAVSDAATAVKTAAAPVVNAVNPASQTNMVQKVGTAAVSMVDPKVITQDLSLSTKIVDWFNFGGVNSYDPNKK